MDGGRAGSPGAAGHQPGNASYLANVILRTSRTSAPRSSYR